MSVRPWWLWGLGLIGIVIVALLAIIAYALLSDGDGEPAAQVAQPTATATPTPVARPTPTPFVDVSLSEKCSVAYVRVDAFYSWAYLVSAGVHQPTQEESDRWSQWLIEDTEFLTRYCSSASVVPVRHPGADIATVCMEARVEVLDLEQRSLEERTVHHNQRLASLQTFIAANCE
jgi:hypothetical protein